MGGPSGILPSVIYFDVGGVLSTSTVGAKKRALEATYRLPANALDTDPTDYRQLGDYGVVDDCDYWRLLLRDRGVTIAEEDCDLSEYIAPVPGMIELLQDIAHDPSIHVGVLSDDTRAMARARGYILGYHGANKNGARPIVPDELFIISGDWHTQKADGVLYDIALRSAATYAGVPPEEVLFIDDKPANIAQAQQKGMQTVLFNADPNDPALRRKMADAGVSPDTIFCKDAAQLRRVLREQFEVVIP